MYTRTSHCRDKHKYSCNACPRSSYNMNCIPRLGLHILVYIVHKNQGNWCFWLIYLVSFICKKVKDNNHSLIFRYCYQRRCVCVCMCEGRGLCVRGGEVMCVAFLGCWWFQLMTRFVVIHGYSSLGTTMNYLFSKYMYVYFLYTSQCIYTKHISLIYLSY